MALASRRIKQFEIDPQELERQIQSSMGNLTDTALLHTELTTSVRDITVDSVDERTGMVVMDIGGKSEGSIALAEFGEVLPKMGETYEVFYDGLDEHDTAQISKRRADRLRAWERVSTKYHEGDEVQGVVQSRERLRADDGVRSHGGEQAGRRARDKAQRHA